MNTEELRESYDARMRQFIDGWSAGCARRGMGDWQILGSTANPYYRTLEHYLHTRAARS